MYGFRGSTKSKPFSPRLQEMEYISKNPAIYISKVTVNHAFQVISFEFKQPSSL